jgi:two-component system, chemotaxis family, chemotaxis protein CheY
VWSETVAKRIIAVDDSKTMREMVSVTLRSAGFEVTVAEDGQKALTILRGAQIDLVITDLNMPNLDGISLIRALRADPRHRVVPILMLTTEQDPARKAEGRAAGATGWLVKPFNPEKLIELAHRVCA